jgi:uncharacterized integral membrane protein
MASWGSPVFSMGKQLITSDQYDAPQGEVIQIEQVHLGNWLGDENAAVNNVIQTLAENGQQPIYVSTWKDWQGMHVTYQYRSSGELVTLIVAAIIVALVVIGIYLITQAAYKVLEVAGPVWGPIILVLLGVGVAGAGIYAFYKLVR